MASTFPATDDVFDEPAAPGSTVLASAGSGSRKHSEHHRDLGDAAEEIQANSALLIHDHSGSGSRATSKLAGANTHQSSDTDTAVGSLHHTLGASATQAAAGNHAHAQATSHSSPDTDSATSSLHHTLGTGATQGAAGNHTHTQANSHGSPDTDSATSSLHHTVGSSATQYAAGSHKYHGQVIGFTASTSNSSSAAVETATLTGSSITLKAGEAYWLEMGGISNSSLSQSIIIKVRKTNASGTVIVQHDIEIVGGTFWKGTCIRNNTGADISFAPCFTMLSSLGGANCTIFATATNPRFMMFTYLGNASDFANAISVT